MNKVDCELKKYETSKPRLILGDKARLEDVVKDLNKAIKKRDGFLKQGHNRANISDAIHALLDLKDQVGLQSTKKQVQMELPVTKDPGTVSQQVT
jgi:hypothetical protein